MLFLWVVGVEGLQPLGTTFLLAFADWVLLAHQVHQQVFKLDNFICLGLPLQNRLDLIPAALQHQDLFIAYRTNIQDRDQAGWIVGVGVNNFSRFVKPVLQLFQMPEAVGFPSLPSPVMTCTCMVLLLWVVVDVAAPDG